MRIAVSGSIATDHLMSFAGRFAEQLLPESLASLSVSFLVDDLQIRRGGVAANITYGMSRLGVSGVLVGPVGSDAKDYVESLADGGVDTSGVRTSVGKATARFSCITDADQNQIGAFYPGAMSEAADIAVSDLGPLDLIMISPNAPAAMVAHAEQARAAGIKIAADPSQQLASLEPEAVKAIVQGADLLFCNEYEAAMLESKTGWSAEQVTEQVGTKITTKGVEGVQIDAAGQPRWVVPVAPANAVVDPTGVGDAFRGGFLAATARGLSMERAVQLGTLMATLCLESVGPQDYSFEAARDLPRLASTHGDEAAREIEAATQAPSA